MSIKGGPDIPTSGLVMYVDAANVKSYPGTGTTWFDLTTNGHNITLGAGVSLQRNESQGVLQFAKDATGTGTNTSLNLSNSDNTIISFVRKLVAGDAGRTITAINNNWLLAHHDTTWGDYYAEGWVNDVSSPSSDTTWRMFTATGAIASDSWATYANLTLLARNANGSQGPNGWNLNGQYSQHSTCQIANLLAWNRVLNDSEIAQVFNAFKGRFNI